MCQHVWAYAIVYGHHQAAVWVPGELHACVSCSSSNAHMQQRQCWHTYARTKPRTGADTGHRPYDRILAQCLQVCVSIVSSRHGPVHVSALDMALSMCFVSNIPLAPTMLTLAKADLYVSSRKRDWSGCCHAHSNCSAVIYEVGVCECMCVCVCVCARARTCMYARLHSHS